MLNNDLPRWSLKDLYSTLEDSKLDADLSESLKLAQAFNQHYKGRIAQANAKALAQAFNELEHCYSLYYKASQYIRLSYAANTLGQLEKACLNKCEKLGAELANLLLFFRLEMGQADSEKTQEWLSSQACNPYRYTIEQTIKKAQYSFTDLEEQWINTKDVTGIQASRKLYGELTASFEFEFELDGQTELMTGSQMRALRYHQDSNVRSLAMKTFFQRYQDHSLTMTHLFNTILSDYGTEIKKRTYQHPMQAMNIGNDLPDAVIDTLHTVTNESYSLVQRYYTIKKRILKLDTLTLADIYAPLPFAQKQISWDQAKTWVLEAFKDFSADFYHIALSMFEKERVDVPVVKGKRGGAFCSSSTPDIYPYVLLNYLGKSRDVSTLAHEFGHAIHAVLSAKQNLFNYHAILPLCETASVFCEMCLIDYRRKVETNPVDKIVLLMDSLEDIFATSHRQNMFSNFERKVHDRVSTEWIDADTFCELYLQELKRMFGKSVEIPEHYRWEWATIPHMLDVPFYVHSYNFGNLLVIALYQKYQQDKDAFAPKLIKLLESGSVASPIQLTQALGIDLHSPEFWRGSLTVIEDLVNELENLVDAHENTLHQYSS